MKLCPWCKERKPDKDFYSDNRVETGLQSHCKKCQKKCQREKCNKYGIGLGTLGRYGLKIGLAIYDKFERKCLECNSENDLTIHHLDGNGRNNAERKLPVNNELDNLILICRRCHGSIHGKEHGKNFRRK